MSRRKQTSHDGGMSCHQKAMKLALHHELKTEMAAYFETKLAYALSEQTVHFKSVKKVSEQILALIKVNKMILLTTLESSPHVDKDLLSADLYGRLQLRKGEVRTGGAILNLLIQILSDPQLPLAKTLLIHCFFIYRLYDLCDDKSTCTIGNKDSLVKKIFHNRFFSERHRKKNKSVTKNKKVGTINSPMLSKMVKKPILTHGSPKDSFLLDEKATFIQSMKQHHRPIASGVSGHAGSLLLGAMLYGGLSTPELQEYLVAVFSFLTIARAHTFHEVMVVGSTLGLPFSYRDYLRSIPQSIRQTAEYRGIYTLFPQYLSHTEESKGSSSDFAI